MRLEEEQRQTQAVKAKGPKPKSIKARVPKSKSVKAKGPKAKVTKKGLEKGSEKEPEEGQEEGPVEGLDEGPVEGLVEGQVEGLVEGLVEEPSGGDKGQGQEKPELSEAESISESDEEWKPNRLVDGPEKIGQRQKISAKKSSNRRTGGFDQHF